LFDPPKRRRNQNLPISSTKIFGGVAAVLSKLREQIRECTLRAENCAYKAKTAPSVFRDDFRMLEKHWRLLAQHYLLTLEEAERTYAWASRRIDPAPASSVFENGRGEDHREAEEDWSR
jgi:hypothetical protein